MAINKKLGVSTSRSLPKVFTLEGDDYCGLSIERVYIGKGAPSEIQDALYLAGICGLVNFTNLTAYVNENIGVDCGGFVANFWGMGRPDLTTPNPNGAYGFKPRTIWNSYPSLRRKTAAEIQPGDAAVFFCDVKDDDPNIAAQQNSDHSYNTASGSQAFHIALVNNAVASGTNKALIDIAESSGAPTFAGGNGVNARTLGTVDITVAKHLAYCKSGKNRIYFVGRPVLNPPYLGNAYED